uniref:DUF4939 domain-containing protein n=1 Tax=Chelonoidis abingdonii TaxID=106734 RepID=A0A8C0QR82_CHEAB
MLTPATAISLVPALFPALLQPCALAWLLTLIPIPDKFDSDYKKFHKFLNQCPLLFLMDLQFFPTDRTRVGLINLLTGEALAWASQLLEKSSPLLSQFKEFGLTLLIRIWEGDEWKSAFHT